MDPCSLLLAFLLGYFLDSILIPMSYQKDYNNSLIIAYHSVKLFPLRILFNRKKLHYQLY